MPTAEELGLNTGAVATDQGSTAQVPDDEKAKTDDDTTKQDGDGSQDSEEAVVVEDDSMDDALDTDDGYTGPKSIAPDEPLHGPAHNGEGHRNVVADGNGNATVLDDDTARVLYENPKFYESVFHNGDSYPVSQLRWANSKGNTVSAEPVGEGYELGQ